LYAFVRVFTLGLLAGSRFTLQVDLGAVCSVFPYGKSKVFSFPLLK